MVHATCRRTLGHGADADDAFQATFLVLARDAARVGNGNALPGWLHRVAVRVAGKSRGTTIRRRAEPLPEWLPDSRSPDPVQLVNGQETLHVVDEELARLPDRFRSVVVLCCLEGRTSGEAADALGCPRGTVDSRLATAKRLLRNRLTRRGIAPAVLAGALVNSPAIPAALFGVTATVAVRYVTDGTGSGPAFFLANGVSPMSNVFRLRLVGVLSLLAASGLGLYFATAAPIPKDPPVKVADPYVVRYGKAKAAAVELHGGTKETEAAVATGLQWLKSQQKKDGSWAFDGNSKTETAAATGLSLLPFLGAGQTHKGKGEYATVVAEGLKFLVAAQNKEGGFQGAKTMYAHAIATTALCEAFGMTSDPELKQPAQKAIDFIVTAQAADGSWGYVPGNRGDTSITGWQIQALRAARACPDLVVKIETLRAASKFLDTVTNAKKAEYGYTATADPRLSTTAVGLFCRTTTDGWTAADEPMSAGVKVLIAAVPVPERFDAYYCYYGTLVVRHAGGEAWSKTWNGAVRDLLVKTQIPAKESAAGSWDADTAMIGTSCGRLGTTSLNLLTLESYYRYLSIFRKEK